MNKYLKIVAIFVCVLSIIKCTTDETATTPIVLNDFTEQKKADTDKIIVFLKSHKINVDSEYNITFDKETNPSLSIWGAGATHGSNVLERECTANNISYTIYFLSLREGGNTARKPCNLDGVLTTYKGQLMDGVAPDALLPNKNVGTIFESNDNPTTFFDLDFVIRGWSEIFPQFAPGNTVSNANGTNTHTDFGAGVMFVPSGLAYFNNARGVIPSYSPLIFSFKLYEVRRNDHDFDGIEDFNEDLAESVDPLNPNGAKIKDRYMYAAAANSPLAKVTDDTDGDGISDVNDQDDDNDRYPTRNELKKPPIALNSTNPKPFDVNGVPTYTGYFNFINVPLCSIGGKKRYLDATCH